MLQNKNIIITGAAGGIGLAAAHRFAREGAFVIGLDVNPTACESASAALAAEGYESLFIPCDISSPEAVDAAFEKIGKAVDRIDAVYNNEKATATIRIVLHYRSQTNTP